MKAFIMSPTLLIILLFIACAGNVERTTGADSQSETQLQSQRTEEGPKKIALIVAVGNYANVGEYPFITEQTREWRDLASKNDVPLLKSALNSQGFKDDNIAILEDKNATYSGITAAIRTQLIDKARTGDIAVFHFSGHGQQVADDNNDEIDGFDESIVPYDAAIKYVSKVYEGANHIRDDLLGALMNELRVKLGKAGHLLVLVDACHSGTTTRGLGDFRGTDEKLAPDNYRMNVEKAADTESFELAGGSRGENEQELAPYVLISGSGADELNYQTVDAGTNKVVGSLSYAFSRAMTKAGSKTTYAGLFDKVRLDMSAFAPRQTPQMEGSKELLLLSGTATDPLNYFTVKDWFDKRNISLPAGELHGLLAGTEVSFFTPEEDTAGKQPIATGRVVNAYFSECDVLLSGDLDKNKALNARAYVTKRNFGDMDVKVKLDINGNADFKKNLEAELSKVPLVKIVDQNSELVIEMNNEFTASRGADAFQVVTTDDYTLYRSNVEEASYKREAQAVTGKAVSYAQAKFLRNIEMNNADMKVTFEFIPVTVEKAGRTEKEVGRQNLSDKMNSKGVIEFKVGDHFKFKVKNESQRSLYYCILDIQPDNVLTPLVPWKDRTPEEYKLKPGESRELPDIYAIYEPAGMENIKLIATEQPIDLKPIVATRGATEKSNNSPLAKLLADSYKTDLTNTRGAATESVPPASGYIHTQIFRIVK